ncbi:MAG: hypothetical protein NWS20_01800 [Rickettsiaceae bacterium]|nr:hypothetical protein [Rickettsiaceae bacterium]MDP4832090.1 hypothetical protein [Rickettsiaceae bacterium]MDP5021174.1 hypothetical protein [Rickettsiaceae bacterium]MDP5083381.1 hypothetical protein [Rickettsiaceae bacterium]
MSKHTTKTKAMPISTSKHTIAEDGIRLVRSAPITIPASNPYFDDYINTEEDSDSDNYNDNDFFVGSYKDYIKNQERQIRWTAIQQHLETIEKVDEEVFAVGDTED